MLLGHWKNFEEIENSLTLEEVQILLDAQRRSEFQKQKFAAALKGVELPDPDSEGLPTFEDVKRRAQAKASGMSEDQIAFMDVGILVLEDDEPEAPIPVEFEVPDMLIVDE
jgi:hypothetical protein